MSKGRTKDVRDPGLLCHAHRTDGDACGAYVIRGGAGVCKAHGGAAPRTRQKAQERLEAMRMVPVRPCCSTPAQYPAHCAHPTPGT
jgi:hypothetical protein